MNGRERLALVVRKLIYEQRHPDAQLQSDAGAHREPTGLDGADLLAAF
jgi:hypothetical protein